MIVAANGALCGSRRRDVQSLEVLQIVSHSSCRLVYVRTLGEQTSSFLKCWKSLFIAAAGWVSDIETGQLASEYHCCQPSDKKCDSTLILSCQFGPSTIVSSLPAQR